MQTRLSAIALTFLLAASATACDKAEGDAKGDAKKANANKSDAKKADAKKADAKKADAKKADEPKPLVMVDHDLSSADPTWEGWVAQGPEGAKVMKDGIKGARIAANGRAGFDLAFAPKKKDLAVLKSSLEKGAENSKGEVKLTFLKEEEGLLEWASDGYGSKTWGFTMHMTVEGIGDVTCQNNIMMGLTSEKALADHKAACATLKKK
ncbi:MAG: hypothetical protein K0V04_14995 [Deltaproteobacteria bacterium]|nr:hypothetical protein [Deltaproteobacteria bacterium]